MKNRKESQEREKKISFTFTHFFSENVLEDRKNILFLKFLLTLYRQKIVTWISFKGVVSTLTKGYKLL